MYPHIVINSTVNCMKKSTFKLNMVVLAIDQNTILFQLILPFVETVKQLPKVLSNKKKYGEYKTLNDCIVLKP